MSTLPVKTEKKSFKNNGFKISAPTQNNKYELLDGSYSVLDIQDYLIVVIQKIL